MKLIQRPISLRINELNLPITATISLLASKNSEVRIFSLWFKDGNPFMEENWTMFVSILERKRTQR